MAGYTNNYAGYDDPEYQSKPNADSINGTYGSNTTAARQNQQDYASQARNGGGAPKDPYMAFSEASRNWWPRRPPQQTPPIYQAPQTTPKITTPPSALSSLLRGQQPPPAPPQQATMQPEPAPQPAPPAETVIGTPVAQPPMASLPVMPPSMPQLPSSIPSVPDLSPMMADAKPPVTSGPIGSGLANTIRGQADLASESVNSPVIASAQTVTPPSDPNTAAAPPPAKPLQMLSAASVTPYDPNDPDHTAPPPTTPPPVVPPPVVPNQGQQQTPPPAPPPPPRTRPSAPPVQYSDANPPPKPSDADMADPEKAAAYYRLFTYKNPAFANVSGADVNAQRSFAVSGAFAKMGHPEYQDLGTWFLAGKPTPPVDPGNQTGAPPTTPPTRTLFPGDPGFTIPPGMIWDPYHGLIKDPSLESQPGNTTPGTPPSSPPVDPVVPPPPGSPADGNGSDTPDLTTQERAMYDPLFKQQQSELARTLRAQAALDGSINSGGFNESLGRAESNLSANQGAQLASLTEAERNRQQAMTIAVMQDATQRYGIKTNDDLQRWLNDPNNDTLQKYGIDKNDLLERYKSQLALEGAQASASSAVSAAALQAATQAAIAAGNNATQLKLGQMSNDLGYANLQGNLYQSDQANYVAELKMLTDAGISQSTIAAILAAFGPSPPIYTTHP